jgi:hypothetical protein
MDGGEDNARHAFVQQALSGRVAPLITRILVGLIAGGLAYRLFKRRLP